MDIHGCALVVGGGSGIGRACCLAFAREGAQAIVVADINLKAAQEVAAMCWDKRTNQGMKIEAIEVDVRDENSVKKATENSLAFLGRIDYCVNCAGIGIQLANEVAEADVTEFAGFIDVNVTGTLLVTREVSAIMKAQQPRLVEDHPESTSLTPARFSARGAIVNMGSAQSFASLPGMVQYTTSKFAVLGLSKNAALDNATHGIRVNCVCPSWVDTPMVQKAVDKVPGLKSFIEKAVPLGRIAYPEEVADCVIFLCSPRSSYVTGCGFIIDGGTTLTCHV